VVQHTPREQKGHADTLTIAGDTQRIIQWAVTEAERMGNAYIGTQHLLLGMSRDHDCVASKILRRSGVSSEELRRQIRRVVNQGVPERLPSILVDGGTYRETEMIKILARLSQKYQMEQKPITVQMLVMEWLQNYDDDVKAVLSEMGVDSDDFWKQLRLRLQPPREG
jgi:ATP-dependent Clp protease ATP-binding subunit ClpA